MLLLLPLLPIPKSRDTPALLLGDPGLYCWIIKPVCTVLLSPDNRTSSGLLGVVVPIPILPVVGLVVVPATVPVGEYKPICAQVVKKLIKKGSRMKCLIIFN